MVRFLTKVDKCHKKRTVVPGTERASRTLLRDGKP